MTSKISFSKLVKEDLKNRSWLFAMAALALFIAQPVALMMRLGSVMEEVKNHYRTMDQALEFYRRQVGFGNGLTLAVLMGIAVVCAFTGFQYLHSKMKLDFYHSLSVKRRRLFFVQYSSGILIYGVPSLICMCLCLAVGGVNGILTGSMIFLALKAYVVHFFYYLLIYATGILAMMLTGKLITAILAFGVFVSYSMIVNLVISELISQFFTTAIDQGVFLNKWTRHLSPAFFCVFAEEQLASRNASVGSRWLCIGFLLVMVFALTAACIGIYSIRKTEAADHSMAFPKTEGIIKILLVVPLSIAAGFYVKMMASGYSMVWFFGGIVFAVLILGALIEFIYHLDIREVFCRKLQLLLSALLAIGIVLIFRYDLVGYDTYLPEKEDISAMSIQYDPINGNYAYSTVVTESGTATYYGDIYGLDQSSVKNFDSIYELAEAGVKSVGSKTEGKERIAVKYTLKSGRSVYRAYWLPVETISPEMEKLYNQSEFKKAVYPILRETDRLSSAMTLTTWYGARQVVLTQEEQKKLMEIYQADLLEVTYQELKEGSQIANLGIEFQDESTGETYGSEEVYPVTTECRETIAFLEEKGYEIPLKPKKEGVSTVEVSLYRAEEGRSEDIAFTDPEEIQEILDALSFCNFNGFSPLEAEVETDYSVILSFNSNTGNLWGYFEKGKIPDIVKKRFEMSEDGEAASREMTEEIS